MNKQTQEALRIQSEKVYDNLIYKIVCANTVESLESSVNWHLRRGWELTGGIAFGAKFCGQPMIKRLDK